MYTKEVAALPPGALAHPSILLTDGGKGGLGISMAWRTGWSCLHANILLLIYWKADSEREGTSLAT